MILHCEGIVVSTYKSLSRGATIDRQADICVDIALTELISTAGIVVNADLYPGGQIDVSDATDAPNRSPCQRQLKPNDSHE